MSPYLPEVHIRGSEAQRNPFKRLFFSPLKRHLARVYLVFLRLFGLKVVAITGSQGKTTIKEMIASVLSRKYSVSKSKANIDPVYNIPNSILSTSLGTKYLVLEYGVEYPGEMDYYLWLCKPDIAVITSISLTHTQFLKSVDGVKKEKEKILKYLSSKDTAVLNIDSSIVRDLAKDTSAKVLFFGNGGEAIVKSGNVLITSDFKTSFDLILKGKREKITLSMLGEHFVSLALGGALVGFECGVPLKDIKKGLEEVNPLEHRMVVKYGKKNEVIIDDTYNANPLATQKALETFSKLKAVGRKIFVFGEMRELGKFSKDEHKNIANKAILSGVEYIIGYMGNAKETILQARKLGLGEDKSLFFEDFENLVDFVSGFVGRNDLLLIKGSRKLGLERLVEKLER